MEIAMLIFRRISMGVKYEMNWYLVVNELDDVTPSTRDGAYATSKEGGRIYPIGALIPLIYKKDEKCVGMVKVKAFKVTEEGTDIWFDMVESYDKFYPIAQHYYEMYKSMKG